MPYTVALGTHSETFYLLMLRFNVQSADKHRLTFRALDWEKGPAVDEVLGECFMELNCMYLCRSACVWA